MMTPSEHSDADVLHGLALEYLATVEGDRRYRTFPGDRDVLRDQILTLLGRDPDDELDLLQWAQETAGGRRLGDDPEDGDIQLGDPHRLRVGDHVGVLIRHEPGADGSLYAVVQTAARGYVIVPDEETREASEEEAIVAVRERLDDLMRYAELLHVDEATLRQLCDEALANYEPLRALLVDWPVGPESK